MLKGPIRRSSGGNGWWAEAKAAGRLMFGAETGAGLPMSCDPD